MLRISRQLLSFTVGYDFDYISQHKMERPKKDSVISKHRKWLADLQKQKDFLESQQIFEMAQKKEVQMKVCCSKIDYPNNINIDNCCSSNFMTCSPCLHPILGSWVR